MSFKKMLEEDVDNIFLNQEEFADDININGKSYKGVLDYRTTESAKVVVDGVNESDEANLYVKSLKEFSTARYKKGKSIEINDETFIIKGIAKEEGMLVFKLSRNDGY
ncbi:MAG: hypothetical protein RSB77_04120 [Bacilli bacterium]|uniref:hypothetical protein n=1 Tax=Cetobacterium sp. TaxID=2071632 RepID=UPI002FC760D0